MARRSDSPLTLPEWAAIWMVVVVWGVNNAAGKLATAVLPPLFVGGVRFAVALVFLLPFIKPPFPPWRSFLPVVLIMGPIHFGLVYTGFYLAHNLSLFSVSLQLWIPLAALFSWLILHERTIDRGKITLQTLCLHCRVPLQENEPQLLPVSSSLQVR